MVGRTPWSAADAPVGLLAPWNMPMSLFRMRVQGDPRGPGGPPHLFPLPYIRQLHSGGEARSIRVRESSSR